MLKLQPSKNHMNIFSLQSLEAELICSTAYVDLFIRRITEPSLLAVFLRFIFTDVCDDKNIIDTLVARLGLQSQVNISISICMNSQYNTKFPILTFNFWLKLIMFLQILQLCTVTLSLFETLVGLNCEDVMLWLVFRHLIPMDHLVPCQRPSIKQPDLHGRASERYVSTSIEIQNNTFI